LKQIAQRGMIALALAQSPEFVAPFGAAAALYGTNPIGASCAHAFWLRCFADVALFCCGSCWHSFSERVAGGA
jgi:hypothetical protein